jgi:hypothetical protein
MIKRDESWDNQDDLQGDLFAANNSYSGSDAPNGDDDWDNDDLEDEELEDDDLDDDTLGGGDIDTDYDNLDEDDDVDDDDTLSGSTGFAAGFNKNERPNEIPEEQEAENEGTGYSREREYDQPQEGNDASYSEQTDVTPPKPNEFPSEGPAKTNFESRPHGRTTGRMIGHEPGTEGV